MRKSFVNSMLSCSESSVILFAIQSRLKTTLVMEGLDPLQSIIHSEFSSEREDYQESLGSGGRFFVVANFIRAGDRSSLSLKSTNGEIVVKCFSISQRSELPEEVKASGVGISSFSISVEEARTIFQSIVSDFRKNKNYFVYDSIDRFYPSYNSNTWVEDKLKLAGYTISDDFYAPFSSSSSGSYEDDMSLLNASKFGNDRTVERCLCSGANVNVRVPFYPLTEESGFTPLMLACKYGHTAVMRLLVEDGNAKLDVSSGLLTVNTPLTLSSTREHKAYIENKILHTSKSPQRSCACFFVKVRATPQRVFFSFTFFALMATMFVARYGNINFVKSIFRHFFGNNIKPSARSPGDRTTGDHFFPEEPLSLTPKL